MEVPWEAAKQLEPSLQTALELPSYVIKKERAGVGGSTNSAASSSAPGRIVTWVREGTWKRNGWLTKGATQFQAPPMVRQTNRVPPKSFKLYQCLATPAQKRFVCRRQQGATY